MSECTENGCSTQEKSKEPSRPTSGGEVTRRKIILQHYIGEPVTLKEFAYLRWPDARYMDLTLLAVNRTRVEVGYPNTDKVPDNIFAPPKQPWKSWTIPIDWVLLPGAIESAPGQRYFFDAGVAP